MKKEINNIKTSIIVPIYNVEKYLPKCLNSLIHQTLKDIEIICINDESPDNCNKILEEYAQKDKRIIVLNQKNSGQGSARNRGLEIAKGKYIQFLDSDDFYEPNCCEEMYNLMEKYKDIDVACFDTNIIYEAYEDRKAEDEKYFKMHYTGKQHIKQAMISSVDCNCWNKIFRKSFIDKNQLRFPEKLHYEDYAFFWFWITRANQIFFYPKKLTNYLRRTGSFLGEIFEKNSKTIFDDFKIFELIYHDLEKYNKLNLYKQTYVKRYLNNVRWLINCISHDAYNDKKKLVDIWHNFLSTINTDKLELENWEYAYLEAIRKQNYFFFNAYNSYHTEKVKPIYNNSINIVMATDCNYVTYLGVTIQSIVDNSSLQNNYDIIILYSGIYDYQKRFLLSIVKEKENISLRFFNMDEFIRKYELNKFFTVNHISLSAYFRLFVGKIFHEYKKIIYLDCDLVVTTDIAKLGNLDIAGYPVAAALDISIHNSLPISGYDSERWKIFKKYMADNLNFTTPQKYFNSGIMIIDIEKFNDMDFEYLLDLAKRNNRFFHDQNVLNAAFEDNYFQLPQEWNFQWNIKFHSTNDCYKTRLETSEVKLYDSYDIMPAIIHYTSHEKPWKNPYHSFANIWWKYARKTPFYEIILKDLISGTSKQNFLTSDLTKSTLLQIISYPKNKIRYWRYKLLSKITLGNMRKHYKQKKKELKERIRQVRRFLKEK